MAGKDEKDLHAKQMTDSELETAVGGASTGKMYRGVCRECGASNGWIFNKTWVENFIMYHEWANAGHYCYIEEKDE